MSKQTWSAPEVHWVPVRRAAFIFHALEGDKFTVVDGTLLREFTEVLATRSGAHETKIDPITWQFSFHYIDDEFSLIGPPWMILGDHGGNDNLKVDVKTTSGWVDDEAGARLKRRYEAVWEATDHVWKHLMLPAFGYAVSAGAILLYARRHLSSAPFERLPMDVWPLLQVVDWSNGAAFDHEGSAYWSIHAELTTVSATSAKSLRKASRSEIHRAIKAAYDNAEAHGTKPPNIKELPSVVIPLLEEKGCSASGKFIANLGGAEQHAARRRPPGKTLLSERRAPRK